MIEFSGRAARAGTRRLAAATAVACLAVAPLAYDATAHADGPGGAAAGHDQGPGARDGDHRAAAHHEDRRPAGRGDDHRPAAQERGRHGAQALPPRTRIVFDAKAPRGPVAPGGTYQFPYTVTNTGAAPAHDVALKARPDQHLKVVTTPPKCHWTSHNNLVCRIGLIPGGETRKGSITAKVDKNAPAGRPLSNPVRLTWDGRPDRDARHSGFPDVTVGTAPAGAVGSAATTLVPAAGTSAETPYEVSVTKNGPVTAESMVVRRAVAGGRAGEPCAAPLPPLDTLLGGVGPLPAVLPSCDGARPRAATDDPPCAACARPSCSACAVPNTSVTPDTPNVPPAERQAPPVAQVPPAAQVPGGGEVPVAINHERHHPIGVPPHRARPIGPPAHAWPHAPHRMSCAENPSGVGCHTRGARPMGPQAGPDGNRLPHTGFAYGLLGLCGVGLTGLGFVLYRMGRARRGRVGQAAIR